LAEQVGVNAPGSPKIAIVLPELAFWMSKLLGPTEQPLPSTSMNSCRLPAGSLSPTLIMDESPLETMRPERASIAAVRPSAARAA
jgi:hypothetical protein